jgi:hypothetical protein
VPCQRALRAQPQFVVADPDLAVVVHHLGSHHHGVFGVAEQIEVRPEGRTDKGHAVDFNRIVLQNVDVGAGSKSARLLDGTVDVAAVEFMIAGDIDHGTIGDALKNPSDTALHASDQVAGNDEHVVMRPISRGRQVPAARQFHVQV